jgi:hypothetical protein
MENNLENWDFDTLRIMLFKHAQYPENPDKEYEQAKLVFDTIVTQRALKAFRIISGKQDEALQAQKTELREKIEGLKFKELNWLEWKATHNKALDQVIELLQE